MTEIEALIKELKNWGGPRRARHRGERCLLLLSCFLSAEPAAEAELSALGMDFGLTTFWRHASGASLFKDAKYSQWGVQILSPVDAISESSRQRRLRAGDFTEGDLVIGKFFGDSDLLVMDRDGQNDHGCVIRVAWPLDRRKDWPVVAPSFRHFLESYIRAEGDKYWEIAK